MFPPKNGENLILTLPSLQSPALLVVRCASIIINSEILKFPFFNFLINLSLYTPKTRFAVCNNNYPDPGASVKLADKQQHATKWNWRTNRKAIHK